MVGGPSGSDRGDGGGEWFGPLRSQPARSARPRRRAVRRMRGRGGGQLRIPAELPTVPTVLAAVTAVVLAFIIGRAAGGGGDADTSSKPTHVASSTTTTAALKHTVTRGETLASIASQYGVTTAQIAELNGITDLNKVFVGQVLSIPARVP